MTEQPVQPPPEEPQQPPERPKRFRGLLSKYPWLRRGTWQRPGGR